MQTALLAELDQVGEQVLDVLLKQAALHDGTEEHAAVAEMMVELYASNTSRFGLAAAVARLAIRAHRSGTRGGDPRG